ncbi:DUF488 family protein [Fusobacterium varium]|uniref:DUF488 domain-containing protein n=1 Tax=Fusobacterium varium TaxID=856 RepID=UPI000BBAC7B6|nr:hypothetical protein FV113G1_26630 [Fusobacterium varium]
MKIFTIGVNDKNAEEFFTLLNNNEVTKVIDIRLNNTTQLCGFTKMNDLNFFLKRILNIDYEYISDFAPTKDIMVKYRENKDQNKFKIDYLDLMKERKVKEKYKNYNFGNICFLCSEDKADSCHRKILSEYLDDIKEIIHL